MMCKRQHGTNELLEMVQEGGAAGLAVETGGAIGVMQESAGRVVVVYRLGLDNGALAGDARGKVVVGGEWTVYWRDGRRRAASGVLQELVSFGGVWEGILQSLFVKLDLFLEVFKLCLGDGHFFNWRRVYTLAIGRGT